MATCSIDLTDVLTYSAIAFRNLNYIYFSTLLIWFHLNIYSDKIKSWSFDHPLCLPMTFKICHEGPPLPLCIGMGDNFIFFIANLLFSIFFFLYMIYIDDETISVTIYSMYQGLKSLNILFYGQQNMVFGTMSLITSCHTTEVQTLRKDQVKLWKI